MSLWFPALLPRIHENNPWSQKAADDEVNALGFQILAYDLNQIISI